VRNNWEKGGGVWGFWRGALGVYVAHVAHPLRHTHTHTRALHKLSKLLFKSPPRGRVWALGSALGCTCTKIMHKLF